jgi:hypothetical protein
VIELAETTVHCAAGVLPNMTADTPAKFDPLIVIEPPPSVLPVEELRPVTVGVPGADALETQVSVRFVGLYDNSNRLLQLAKTWPVTLLKVPMHEL